MAVKAEVLRLLFPELEEKAVIVPVFTIWPHLLHYSYMLEVKVNQQTVEVLQW
jgi:H2-forming N5,N10-methylenetetrahydromethanopterin dehydrogenase-like enzyme